MPVSDNAAKVKTRKASDGSLLGGLRGKSAAAIFYEEVPPELRPTPQAWALDVAMIWGDAIIEARQFEKGQVKVGGAPVNDFHLYFESVDSHVLATLAGPQAKLQAPPNGKIVLRRGGRDEDAGASATIGLDERARIRVGGVEFVVRFVKPQQHLKTGLREQVDLYFTKVLSIAVMAHVALLAAMMVTPLDNPLLSEDLFKQQNRYTKMILRAPEQKKKTLEIKKEKEKVDDGQFGKKLEVTKENEKKGPQIDAAKREQDRKKVMAAGLLGAMGDGAASNIFGGGGLGTGINNALGGLQSGQGLGDAHGVGGLGSRGAGFGGGGGGLGLGGLGTKGGGRGGHGQFNLGAGSKGSTRIIPGKTTVVGGLSKDVIGKVIRRHWNEVKYCYEKELQKDPNLEGKVAMMFVIDGTGRVAEVSVQQDTTGNGAVADCMSSKIRRWVFPEPQGGGQVMVTYPWIFRAAGSAEGEE